MKIIQKIMMVLATTIAITLLVGLSALAQTGVVNTSVLNVREWASQDATIIGKLSDGTKVDIIEASDNWYTISYNGASAFVVSKYIDVINEDAAYTPSTSGLTMYGEVWYGKVTADVLNVRADASFDARICRKLNRDHRVEVRGEQGDFYIIENGEWNAFVAKEYIAQISQEEWNAPVSNGSSDVVNTAKQYLGVPYVYGGSSPKGFDCSGFTSYVFAQFGANLSRTASGQANNGTWVAKGDLQPGDLLLFGPYSGGGIGHAGIYIGDGNMIHSPKPGKSVCIESINSSYYSSRYVMARRII